MPAEPSPFDLFVVKVASRCNLACGYCYEYFHGDDSWRAQPKAMSAKTMVQVAESIAVHAERHQLPEVSISLHGGEPLTVGLTALDEYVHILKERIGRRCTVFIGMQTNGTLYDEKVHEWALSRGVGIGISLDGPAKNNDTRRPYHNGRGSTSAVESALSLLAGSPGFSGILSVVDLEADPVETLRYLGQWDPPILDFLLPHGNWEKPPPGVNDPHDTGTVYGHWLARAFDEWWRTDLSSIAIRTFEEIILRLAGKPGRLETLGTEPVTLITIGTDGSYEAVDTLKSSYPGAHHLGLSAWANTLDDVLAVRSVAARQQGTASLCTTCTECPVVSVCGGGYLPHRYGDGTFDHPSVFCADLIFLIYHIRSALEEVVGRGSQGVAASAHG